LTGLRDQNRSGGFGSPLSEFDRSAAHQGGPNSGLLFQITADYREDPKIAGETCSFSHS